MPWKPPPIPSDFKFIAHSETGGEWEMKTADAITLRTPSGDIEIWVLDGQPYIRSFRMQGRVAAGGPDNTILFTFEPSPNVTINFPITLSGPPLTPEQMELIQVMRDLGPEALAGQILTEFDRRRLTRSPSDPASPPREEPPPAS